MSFEILEYPIKSWVLSLIDDEKIKSDMFDLLGEPEVVLKYPSIILYDIENLVEHDKHNLVVKFEQIDRNDSEYKLDFKNFNKCRKVCDQIIGILNDSNTALKMIISAVDKKWVEMFELDKLYITMMNGMKLKLCYEGNDEGIQKKISQAYLYGFQTSTEYENESDGESDDEEDDDQIISKVLGELSIEIAEKNKN
jgi:hypothetical protein